MDSRPLVGRDREVNIVTAFLTDSGRAAALFIGGEAGVGKTRLAEEALAQAGIAPLVGRSMEPATPPYGPLAAALRQGLRRLPPGSPAGHLDNYLALLLPEWGAPPTPSDNPRIDRETLIEALGQAWEWIAADSRLVLFLDDLHWADETTLDLLPGLVERFAGTMVQVLATFRSDDLPRDHRLRRVRNELRRRRLMQEITLSHLTPEGCAALVSSILDAAAAPSLVALIHRQTQGIPLFVEELTEALRDRGGLHRGGDGLFLPDSGVIPIPDTLRDAILLRLDGVGDAGRHQLEAAAVFGMTFPLDLIARLTGDETGMDELFERQVIVETGPGEAAFRHALTLEAIRDAIPWSRRRDLHRRIAGVLETRGADSRRVAEHWLAANVTDRARAALMDAARRSCDVHAYRDAAEAGRRALDIWPAGESETDRLDALERLAHCCQVSGQLPEAVQALHELRDSPAIRGDAQRLATVLRLLATVLGLQGAWEQSLNARKDAADAYERAGLTGDAAAECLAAAARLTGLMMLAEGLALSDRGIALAREAGSIELQARAMALKGNILAIQGESATGIPLVQEALEMALDRNAAEAAAEIYRRMGSCLEYASEFASSREIYLTALDYCHAQGVDQQAQICMGCMSYVLFRTGEWKQCLDVCRDILKADGAYGGEAIAAAVTGLIRGYRGETRPARKLFARAIQLARRDQAQAVELYAILGRAIIDYLDSEMQPAATGFDHVMAMIEELNALGDTALPLSWAVTFFGEARDGDRVVRIANLLTRAAAATGVQEALAALAHALGETALLDGNAEEAERQFRQALEMYDRMQVPVEHIRGEWRLGVSLAAQQQRDEALPHLNTAYRGARNLGMRPLAARIAAHLEGLGATVEEQRSPEAPERQRQGGLTRRQSEIARLIAEGLTNKEIAGRLYLSPRTVEMHVANILDRLDCRSRSEAVARAAELGLLD